MSDLSPEWVGKRTFTDPSEFVVSPSRRRAFVWDLEAPPAGLAYPGA